HDSKGFAARVRAEMHLLVRALANKDWEEAVSTIRQDPSDSESLWDADRFEKALEPFYAEYPKLVFTPEARRHQWTQIRATGDRTWEVAHTLLDPQGDNLRAVVAVGADRGVRRSARPVTDSWDSGILPCEVSSWHRHSNRLRQTFCNSPSHRERGWPRRSFRGLGTLTKRGQASTGPKKRVGDIKIFRVAK